MRVVHQPHNRHRLAQLVVSGSDERTPEFEIFTHGEIVVETVAVPHHANTARTLAR